MMILQIYKGANGMLKMSCELIKNRITDLTSKEINHLLTSILFANNQGMVKFKINHNVMRVEGSMSIRQHYKCIDSLSKKGIYKVYEDGSFTIIGNSTEDFAHGYVLLPNFIWESNFKRANVAIKRLVLLLLAFRTKTQTFRITYCNLCKWLKINRSAKLVGSLNAIIAQGWFVINEDAKPKLRNSILWIVARREKSGTSTFRNKTSEGIVRGLLRMRKIYCYTPKVLSDMIQLYNQYKDDYIRCIKYLNPRTANGKIFRMIICQAVAYKTI